MVAVVAESVAESLAERKARLRLVAERVAPLSLAKERTLPLIPAVSDLFVGGTLPRGLVVAVNGVGATSVALILAAGASQAGSWTAFVGSEDLGLAAVAESGIALERLLVVSHVGVRVDVVAALLDAVDVVLVDASLRLRHVDLRRLSARLRERGSVLIQVGASKQLGVDIGVQVMASQWSGLGDGFGLLRSRKLEVCAQGRGVATKARHISLGLQPESTSVDAEQMWLARRLTCL